MQITEAQTGRLYDRDCYPVAGHNSDDDRRDRWADMPRRDRRELARELIHELLSGRRKADALFWVNRRSYTPKQLENFIANLERGLAARKEGSSAKA